MLRPNIRSALVRSFIIIIPTIFLNLYIFFSPSINPIFDAALRAFQGSTVIFSISVSLATALAMNYVRGSGEAYWGRVASIRSNLEKVYAEHKASPLGPVQHLIQSFVVPMLYVSNLDWQIPDQGDIKRLMEGKTSDCKKFIEDGDLKVGELPWQIIRIEEEFDFLVGDYLKMLFSPHLSNIIVANFRLIALAIACLTLVYLLPSTYLGKLVGANLSIAMISFLVVEIILLSSYLQQQFREEYPSDLEDPSL